MASAIEMSVSRDALDAVIRRVRNRWRLKLALRGLAIVLGVALVVALFGSWIMERERFDPGAVTWARIFTYVALTALTIRYLVMPQLKAPSDERVALYLEEHEPSLDTTVLSAVETATHPVPASVRSATLSARLMDMAVTRAHAVRDGSRIEQRSLAGSLGVLGAILLVGIMTVGLGPDFLRTGSRLLAAPWKSAHEAQPYFITVEPGNAELARGGDQEIRAGLHGFDTEETELVVRRGQSPDWERLPMSATRDSAAYELRLFDVKEPLEYYVEANGVRSPTYRLSVTDLPFVQRIDLEYRYPAYTGMAPEQVQNGGDIAAPKGTNVIVRAHTTMPVQGGRILIEGKEPIAMALDSAGALVGTIAVSENGFYKIELNAADGRAVPGSLDYAIDVLDDNGPTIAFLKPGRDARVTAVEEVFTEVEATDDYGVARLDLVYSVNGGEEKVVPLHGGSRLKEVVAGHTFFLEELGLQPGDLVSYYARARDNDRAGGAGKEAKTDI